MAKRAPKTALCRAASRLAAASAPVMAALFDEPAPTVISTSAPLDTTERAARYSSSKSLVMSTKFVNSSREFSSVMLLLER